MKRALVLPLFVFLFVSAAKPPAKPATPVPPPDLAAPPADAQSLGMSGFFARQLVAPTGTDLATEDDYVRIRYTIWSAPDGKVLDYIAAPGTVVTAMSRMLAGMRLGILQMHPGERRRIWIPESLGATGRVPAGGHMVVDLDLVEIIHPPTTPRDVSHPPADATVTKSGLAYKILRAGTGTKHPRRSDVVRVQYSGWTVDGKLIDSSVTRGEAAEFSLEGVIPGWREGLQLMTEGEKRRFWVPSEIAYNHQNGKPQGMLVFDIELLQIVK
jgi:FKBP-type peptidyl-prolyl cis-trans isomerase